MADPSYTPPDMLDRAVIIKESRNHALLLYVQQSNSFVWVETSYVTFALADEQLTLKRILITGDYLKKLTFRPNYFRCDTIPDLFYDPKPISYTNLRTKIISLIKSYNSVNHLKAKVRHQDSFTITNIKDYLCLGTITESDTCMCCKGKLVVKTDLVCPECMAFIEKETETQIFKPIKISYTYLPKLVFKDQQEILFTAQGIYFKRKKVSWYDKQD